MKRMWENRCGISDRGFSIRSRARNFCKTLRNYVGDEMQGEGELHMTPQGAGHSSIGTRINERDYFKGAVFETRFTPRALEPEEFLKMPSMSGATQ